MHLDDSGLASVGKTFDQKYSKKHGCSCGVMYREAHEAKECADNGHPWAQAVHAEVDKLLEGEEDAAE